MAEKVVLRRELIPAPQNTTKAGFFSERGSLTCTNHEIWQSAYPFDYETAFSILTRDVNSGPITIKFTSIGQNASCDISMQSPAFSYKKTLIGNSRCLTPGHLEVDKSLHQGNIGRILTRNRIEFFYASEQFDKASTRASSSVGGYTWARFGYLPENIDWELGLKAQVRDRLTAIWPLLTAPEKDYIDVYKPMVVSKDLWGIADANFDLRDRLADATPQFMGVLLGTFAYIDRSETLDRIFERVASGKKLSLGQYLLLGTTWDGEIDFNNVEQMKRVDTYTGGFRYIGFE